MGSKVGEVEIKMKKAFCWSDLQTAIWSICQIGKKSGNAGFKIEFIQLEKMLRDN